MEIDIFQSGSQVIENKKIENEEEFENLILSKALFKHCDFFGFVVKDSKFNGCQFLNCDFRAITIKNCNFNDASFICCNFESCAFEGCKCEGTRFKQNVGLGIHFQECNLSSTGLLYSLLEDVCFYRCSMNYFIFNRSTLIGSSFISSSMHKACSRLSSFQGWLDISQENITQFATISETIGLVPLIPSEGSFIGWKLALSDSRDVLVKLLIPKDAQRVGTQTAYCRCSKAKVLEIQFLDGQQLSNTIAACNFGQNLHI